ncbi:hypothetical protein AN3891.2 [Paecilomyces variotii No. 5]|uniref:Geminivirus AL1 replication-associated protein catalytic domain-containing protein n=1 Tax=Byssochlamys spectabilis (strain No. 5 / NBRC 109023) TaxID=1356009 RepID=V5FE54_BYSSN|nr:hypothetical protein AN3891.2 [Paecilomyces variotii No. 5]
MLHRNGFVNATYYGCREHHEVTGIHYHVLANLRHQPNWSFSTARERFHLEGNDCDSLDIVTPRKYQWTNPGPFIANHVRSCESKGGIVFGKRPDLLDEEERRKWGEIRSLPTPAEKYAKLKEYWPDVYYKHFNDIQSAIDYEHQGGDFYEPLELPRFCDPQRFRVPDLIVEWRIDNLSAPRPGRRMSLLIVGDTRTGKSLLAQYIASQYGVFSEFYTEWDMGGYRRGHRCAVFHDMKRPFEYYKGVFGCQRYITAHGRDRQTQRLGWDVPSIWVCNYEDDPRYWSDAARRYIEGNAVVYEVPRSSSLYSDENYRGVTGSEEGAGPAVSSACSEPSGLRDLDDCMSVSSDLGGSMELDPDYDEKVREMNRSREIMVRH